MNRSEAFQVSRGAVQEAVERLGSKDEVLTEMQQRIRDEVELFAALTETGSTLLKVEDGITRH